MEDLLSKLQNILSSPEGQEQLKNIQNMLGNSSGPEETSQQPSSPQESGGFDFSALAGMLSGMAGGGQQSAPQNSPPPNPPAQNPQNGGFDLSALAGMLSGMAGGGQQSAPQNSPPPNAPTQNPQNGGFDFSALAGMLSGTNASSGGQQAAPAAGGMPNIDINMILKLQQIFRSVNVNDKNSQLLLALKPHFGERRQTKVDQAISMMRLFSMLPALKESGIFSGLL